ncbi:hypothetical protein GOBAR_DD35548 [Gossypium barbadense]|nr:hypothetical protein GOBAR_DD35548 [Gossypium barbadense]
MQNKGQKVEVEMVHPWPEWIELMERLVQQNYFDHKRRDDEKMVEYLGFDMTNVVEEVKDDAGIDFKDYKTVQTACINKVDFRSLSRQDIQILVGFGCPNADKKVVFSVKLLRKCVHLDEGDVRLIEGIIDQVEGTIHVSWVQPRVLGIPQINRLRDWLDNWTGKDYCQS